MLPINARLEPLINDLETIKIGDYLKSNEFKRLLIKIGFEKTWQSTIKYVESHRTIFAPFIDYKYEDSIKAMTLELDRLYSRKNSKFYDFIYSLLENYIEWANNPIDLKNIIEDLDLLNPPALFLEKIIAINSSNSQSVPKSVIPEHVWNSKKLEDVLTKMDNSINQKDYNLTLTYAYSCLEGMYKAFLNKNIPSELTTDKINKLSVKVRDYIKEDFKNKDLEYPEQMITLITTITNAISNARNSYSDSHFDEQSEKCLAIFARDCVNSVGRLILNFM